MVSWIKRAAARTWKVLGVLADSATGAVLDHYEGRTYWHLAHQDRRPGQWNWSPVRSRKSFRTATLAFYPTDVKWRFAGIGLEYAVVAESHIQAISALARFEPVVCEVVTVVPPRPTDTRVLGKFGLDPKTMSIKPMKVDQTVAEELNALAANRAIIIPGRATSVSSVRCGGFGNKRCESPDLSSAAVYLLRLLDKVYQVLTSEHQIQGGRLFRRRITQILDKCDEKELQIILRPVNAIKD